MGRVEPVAMLRVIPVPAMILLWLLIAVIAIAGITTIMVRISTGVVQRPVVLMIAAIMMPLSVMPVA